MRQGSQKTAAQNENYQFATHRQQILSAEESVKNGKARTLGGCEQQHSEPPRYSATGGTLEATAGPEILAHDKRIRNEASSMKHRRCRKTNCSPTPPVPKNSADLENGSSRGFPIIVVEHPAQFIAAADAAHLGEARRRLDQFVGCLDDCAAGDKSQRRSRWWSADVVRSGISDGSNILP